MNYRELSIFLVGLMAGLIVAVGGFALYVRSHALSGGTTTVLKLAHGLAPSHPVHRGMVYMAELVAKKSAGQVSMQIFADGVLGSETENIEQLQRGALAISKVSAAALESFIPEMGVFGLPYLFRDHQQFWQILTGNTGKEMLALGDGKGLHGLCYYDSGSRNFYTVSKPIQTPDDVRGLKIRVQQSRMAMEMVSAFGAAPTPISWGELYTALQQGVVDGAENNPPSFYTNRHYEVCKFFALNEHTRVPDVLLVSQKVWQGLSPQVQQWIQEAADESSVYQRKLWQEETDKALAAIAEKGVQVLHPDTAAFAERTRPLRDQYTNTPVGPWMRRIEAEQQ